MAAVNDLQKRCITLDIPGVTNIHPPRFAFMAPTRVRAKDIAWQYLKLYSKPIPGIKVSESELFVEYPNGGRVTIYGADGDRGMGIYLDGIVFDECDEIPPSVDDVVEPALSDRKGWTVHMGILRGRHNLHKRFEKYRGRPDHFQLKLRASDSGIIDPGELNGLRERMGQTAYDMQMEGDVNASMANAIYGREMDLLRSENRLTLLAYDRTVPMDFFFDIGHALHGDDWSVWGAQLSNRDILLQKYFAKTGELPAYYARKCIEFVQEAGLILGTVYLPHDGARTDRNGRTAKDDLMDAGIPRVKVVPRTPVLWDSINYLRSIFPRILIDNRRCTEIWTLGDMEMPSGVDCLDYYTKKVEEQSGLITDVPVHNQYSHGADSLRTLAEASRLGMIDGTSFTAKQERKGSNRVLRGPGPGSYSVPMPNRYTGRVLR